MQNIKTLKFAKSGYERVSNFKMEHWFLLIFLLAGFTFALLVPPGWNTDESNHSYRIQQLSQGSIFSSKTIDPQTELRAYGGNVSKGLIDLFNYTGSSAPGAVGDRDIKIKRRLYFLDKNLTGIRDNKEKQPINFSGAALYSPVSYAVFVPVFWIGTKITLSWLWIIIIGRIIGVIMTGLAFYFAIKIIPIGKWIILAIGLIPTVIVQAATVGADSLQLSACILFISYTTKLIYRYKKLGLFDYAILLALGSILVLIKIAYAPIIVILLGLPLLRKEYRNRQTVLPIIVIILLSIIPAILWTKFVSYIDINSNPQSNFTAQKSFILSQPITYGRTMFNTYFTNSQTALSNIFGSFIWDSTPLPAIYSYVCAAAITCSIFVNDQREVKFSVLEQRQKIIWKALLVFSALSSAILISTALYIYSTTYRQSSIVGIQSRYFIPILPLILLCLYGPKLSSQKTFKRSIFILSCIAISGAVISVYLRLYQSPVLIIK